MIYASILHNFLTLVEIFLHLEGNHHQSAQFLHCHSVRWSCPAKFIVLIKDVIFKLNFSFIIGFLSN